MGEPVRRALLMTRGGWGGGAECMYGQTYESHILAEPTTIEVIFCLVEIWAQSKEYE